MNDALKNMLDNKTDLQEAEGTSIARQMRREAKRLLDLADKVEAGIAVAAHHASVGATLDEDIIKFNMRGHEIRSLRNLSKKIEE
jgi:hypothetical protein